MPKKKGPPQIALGTSLDDVLDAIDDEFGAGTMMRMGRRGAQVKVKAQSTGVPALDLALGIGGMPLGRLVEVFGPESSGKTTLVYHVIAAAQARGYVCAFIDAEHSMDPLYAARIGVDLDALLVSQPDYGEQALEIADMLARSGAVQLIVVDSVAALTPRAELEGKMGDVQVGTQARMMSQAMRKLAANLNRSKTLCVFTNQIREKVGVLFGSPETQPGGRALKFYSSQRIDLRRIETLKNGTEVIGIRVRAKVVKNKVARPATQAEYDIKFGEGISAEASVFDLGVENEVIEKAGTFFKFNEETLGRGRDNAVEYLEEHPETFKALRTAIYLALEFVETEDGLEPLGGFDEDVREASDSHWTEEDPIEFGPDPAAGEGLAGDADEDGTVSDDELALVDIAPAAASAGVGKNDDDIIDF